MILGDMTTERTTSDASKAGQHSRKQLECEWLINRVAVAKGSWGESVKGYACTLCKYGGWGFAS